MIFRVTQTPSPPPATGGGVSHLFTASISASHAALRTTTSRCWARVNVRRRLAPRVEKIALSPCVLCFHWNSLLWTLQPTGDHSSRCATTTTTDRCANTRIVAINSSEAGVTSGSKGVMGSVSDPVVVLVAADAGSVCVDLTREMIDDRGLMMSHLTHRWCYWCARVVGVEKHGPCFDLDSRFHRHSRRFCPCSCSTERRVLWHICCWLQTWELAECWASRLEVSECSEYCEYREYREYCEYWSVRQITGMWLPSMTLFVLH